MHGIRIGLMAAALMAGASAAEAQISVAARDVPPGQRPPRGMCRVWIDGVPAGRQPRPTDCGTAQARATTIPNSRVIVGDNTPFPGRARGRVARECTFDRTTTAADVILGGRRTTATNVIFGRRAGERDCIPSGRRQLGAWYEVGRNRNGTRIYQRRVRLVDGTIVVQRARRTRDGAFVVSDMRYPRPGINDRNTDEDWWTRADRRRVRQSRRTQGRPDVRAPGLDVARERVQGTPAEPVIERVHDDVRDDGRGRDDRPGPPNQSGRRGRGRP
jgi:hypothetical protein